METIITRIARVDVTQIKFLSILRLASYSCSLMSASIISLSTNISSSSIVPYASGMFSVKSLVLFMFGDIIRNILPAHSDFTLEECNKCETKHEEKVPVTIKEQGEKVSPLGNDCFSFC